MNRPDLTICNGLILTMDPLRPLLRGDIRVQDGLITAMDSALSPIDGEVIDAGGLVVIPGFIQTHVHLCQTLFRGLAHDVPLLEWLGRVIKPYEAAHDAVSTYLSARLGISELLLSGTTTVSDFGSVHHQPSILQAIVDSGIRAQTGKTLMDNAGHDASTLYESPDVALAESERLIREWHGHDGDRIRMAVIPRGLISGSEELYRGAVALAGQYGVPIHTHCSENKDEVAYIYRHSGRHPLEQMDFLGVLAARAQLAHCVHLDDEHIGRLAATNAHVLHCPGSNLKLASGIAPLPAMLRAGVKLSLGTDGAACNDNLDMFTEMRLAALIHKPQAGATAVSAAEVFRIATLGGAEALGWEDEIGSLRVGKRADMALLDLNKPHIWPPFVEEAPEADELMARIVYSARAADVEAVIVDGRVLVRDGREIDASPHPAQSSRETLLRLRARAMNQP